MCCFSRVVYAGISALRLGKGQLELSLLLRMCLKPTHFASSAPHLKRSSRSAHPPGLSPHPCVERWWDASGHRQRSGVSVAFSVFCKATWIGSSQELLDTIHSEHCIIIVSRSARACFFCVHAGPATLGPSRRGRNREASWSDPLREPLHRVPRQVTSA